MKNAFLSVCLIYVFSLPVPAQNRQPFRDTQLLKSFTIGVSFNKTVSLIFPSGVHAVDLGSPDVIADKFTGVENVLRVKANIKGFPETNLAVITKDGRYYSFYVNYQEEPGTLTYKMEGNDLTGSAKPDNQAQAKGAPLARPVYSASLDKAAVSFEIGQMNEGELTNYSREIAGGRDNISGIGMNKHKIRFALDGLYIKDNVIFYRIKARNKSNINYDIDFIKFYIRDKKQRKRTAIQELEVMPLFVYPEGENTIYGQSELNRVYCLEKFTLPDKKKLVIEMFEKNGGRVMTMDLTNKAIVKAATINFSK